MDIFFEPVNINQWNMFEEVSGPGHIEPFLATKAMGEGDLVVLHVGAQSKARESGVYAYGTVVNGPYVLEGRPQDYCNNKLSVDVRIDRICYGRPLISHEEARSFIRQFRSAHKINDAYYDKALELLEIPSA